jgi:hypothetical protein
MKRFPFVLSPAISQMKITYSSVTQPWAPIGCTSVSELGEILADQTWAL